MILCLSKRCKYGRLAGMGNEELKKARLKSTTPRLKILQLLENADNKHLSAEDIYQLLQEDSSDISLATIYRTLAQFESAGMVVKHKFSDDASVYELDRGEHHDHLICVRCNQVIEFVDDIIETRQDEIAQKHGFIITDHSLNIFGLCQGCT